MAETSHVRIRSAAAGDGQILAALLRDYLAESYPGHLGTSADVIERDVLSGVAGVQVLLAESRDVAIGFTTWHRVYDLHWSKGGLEIAELYVVPAHRGVGVALAMVAAACAAGQRAGLTYLRGSSFDRGSPVGRFYERIAVAHDAAECHCAGRAFRHLASLDGQPLRSIARRLPPKEWNFDP